MRTSADEVSIHALSPESTFRASSARASEASASTAASASDERTHQYPAPKDRCLLSIVPPEVEEIVSNGGATTRRGGSTGNRRARARSRGHRCPVSGHGLLFVQRQARLGPGAQPPDVAVPERDEGGHDEGRGLSVVSARWLYCERRSGACGGRARSPRLPARRSRDKPPRGHHTRAGADSAGDRRAAAAAGGPRRDRSPRPYRAAPPPPRTATPAPDPPPRVLRRSARRSAAPGHARRPKGARAPGGRARDPRRWPARAAARARSPPGGGRAPRRRGSAVPCAAPRAAASRPRPDAPPTRTRSCRRVRAPASSRRSRPARRARSRAAARRAARWPRSVPGAGAPAPWWSRTPPTPSTRRAGRRAPRRRATDVAPPPRYHLAEEKIGV